MEWPDGVTQQRLVVWPHAVMQRPRGVTVSTLDSESSDRSPNPREAFLGADRRFEHEHSHTTITHKRPFPIQGLRARQHGTNGFQTFCDRLRFMLRSWSAGTSLFCGFVAIWTTFRKIGHLPGHDATGKHRSLT